MVAFVLILKQGNTWTYAISIGLLGPSIFFVIPTSIMHLNHFLSNRKLSVKVDEQNQTVIFQIEKSYAFHFSDLKVTQHLSIYQKNKFDRGRRREAPWSHYSFLRITTPNNMEFNVSSIIMNNIDFPVQPIERKFSGWPSIGRPFVNRQIEIDLQKNERDQHLNNWKQRFEKLSLEEINEKLERPKDLDELPRQALNELRKERKSY
jgi:hypothetical protein